MNFRHISGEPVQLAIDPGFDAMIDRAESFAVGADDVPQRALASQVNQ